jgi:hypothetical protein
MRALLLAGALVIAALWTRTALSARAELAAADAARAAGRLDEACERYQYAMRAYTPLAGAPVAAAHALNAVAREALTRGDRATAIDALQRLRGAALATRGLFAPFTGWLPSTQRQLARSLAAQQIAEGAPAQQRAALEAARLLELQRDPAAAPAWSLLVVIAFMCWLGGAAATLRFGLDEDARLISGKAWRGTLWTAAWLALWVLGLLNA